MKISILISAYNEERNIDRCFESVKNQTFQDFEIICVNDASQDQTLEKLKKWQSIFGLEKFRLINNTENIGLTKSLNLALGQARRKYIARIDADDIWLPDKLKKQVAFMEANPEYGIIGCNYINVFKNNPATKKVITHKTDDEIKRKIFQRNPFAHSCILARKEIIEKAGCYDENIRYGQDYDLWLRCLPLTKFYNLQEFLCERLVSGDGISIRKQNAQMRQSIKTIVKYIKKHRCFWTNYFYLLEPLMIILLPKFIKNLKRKIM